MDIVKYQKIIDKFANERNWDKFHNPKNLVMALAGEVGELTEIFQWLNESQSKEIINSPTDIALVEEEVADVFIYLIRIADRLNIDIEKAVSEKLVKNAQKYPIELSKDNATKYNRR